MLIYRIFVIIMMATLLGIGLIMLGGQIWFWMCGECKIVSLFSVIYDKININ